MDFALVHLETPYASKHPEIVAFHERYARACMRDCLLRDEAPYASHLLYTQPGVLDDGDAVHRKMGMEAGFAWRRVAEKTVVYEDLGVTSGMKAGITHAEKHGRPVERRTLGGTWAVEYAELKGRLAA